MDAPGPPVVVKIVCGANGVPTPHDGRYVVAWNPHVRFGTLAVSSTADKARAKRFENLRAAMEEWKTTSKTDPIRREDGNPNRPLSALTITFEAA